MTPLCRFAVHNSPETIDVAVHRVLIAGFTGRDTHAVQSHIRELKELGVPTPAAVPVVYPLDGHLLVTADMPEPIAVRGAFTSGEVEPVVIVSGGRRWLTVGSDHTDRDLERQSIEVSKAACAKIVANEVIGLDEISDMDKVEIASRIDGQDAPYQRGTLAQLLPLPELEHKLGDLGFALEDGDVLFMGSIPVLDGRLRPTERFAATLRDPQSGAEITMSYASRLVEPDALRDRKPEIEFTPVEGFEWTPVEPGLPGLTERILARLGDSHIATRMLRFAPGTDTTPMGTLTHDFWEEVYILSGSLHDLVLDETFPAGTYACRPPGMPHGPWVAPDGCVTFEVRYAVGEQPLSPQAEA